MNTTDANLNAYLDGELSAADALAFEKELNGSPGAMRDLLAMIRADRAAQNYFHSIDSRPLPAGVLDVLERFGDPETSDADDTVMAFVKPPTPGSAGTRRATWHLPLAASVALMIGIGGGMSIAPGPFGQSGQPMAGLEQSSGVIPVGHPLYSALEQTPSGQTAALEGWSGHYATALATVETVEGGFCRKIEISGPRSLSHAAACRQDSGSWIVKVQTSEPTYSEDGTFRTASAEASAAVETYLRGTGFVEPGREARLLENGWATIAKSQN